MKAGRILLILGVAVVCAVGGALVATALSDDSTPKASGSGANEAADKPSLLFVQDAGGGSFVPIPGSKDYTLTLNDAKASSLFFENRPGNEKGTIDNQKLLDGFFKKPGEDPPNAAIDAWDDKAGDDVVMAVKLIDGKWDPTKHTLTYRVRKLQDASEETAKLAGEDRINATLPAKFGDASVFVDDVLHNNCRIKVAFSNPWILMKDPGMKLLSADKYAPDGWNPKAPDKIVGDTPAHAAASAVEWGSSSSFARGCWTSATYDNGGGGKVSFRVDTPYTDPNTQSCSASGNLTCKLDEGRSTGLEGGGEHMAYYNVIGKR